MPAFNHGEKVLTIEGLSNDGIYRIICKYVYLLWSEGNDSTNFSMTVSL